MAKKRSLFGDRQAKTADKVASLLSEDTHQIEGVQDELPISNIIPDPENPRRVGRLTPQDIQQHVSGETDLALSTDDDRRKYFESLQELANSIKAKGLVNPITVFRIGEHYQIIAGERRYLAHLLLGVVQIKAMIRAEFDVAVQAIENLQREDLTLYETLIQIQRLADVHQQQQGTDITAADIQDAVSKSRKTCNRYLALVTMPEDGVLAIRANQVTRIVDAVKLSELPSPAERKTFIEELAKAAAPKASVQRKASKPAKGRKRQSVNLGSIKNTDTMKALLKKIYGREFTRHCSSLDWSNYDDIQSAWDEAIQSLGQAG